MWLSSARFSEEVTIVKNIWPTSDKLVGGRAGSSLKLFLFIEHRNLVSTIRRFAEESLLTFASLKGSTDKAFMQPEY